MSAATVNASTLRTGLSHWLLRAAKGERVLILRHGQPVAEIGPPPAAQPSVMDTYLEKLGGQLRAEGG